MKLRNRMELFRERTRNRKSLVNTFVTSFGIANGSHTGVVNSEVTLDGLFAKWEHKISIRLQKGDFSAELSSENDWTPPRILEFPFIPHCVRVADTIMSVTKNVGRFPTFLLSATHLNLLGYFCGCRLDDHRSAHTYLNVYNYTFKQ